MRSDLHVEAHPLMDDTVDKADSSLPLIPEHTQRADTLESTRAHLLTQAEKDIDGTAEQRTIQEILDDIGCGWYQIKMLLLSGGFVCSDGCCQYSLSLTCL